MKSTKPLWLSLVAAGLLAASPVYAETQDMALPLPEEQEVKAENEDHMVGVIKDFVLKAMADNYPDGQTMKRDAHPKTHGLVQAKLIVEPMLPQEFRQGIFAQEREYDALVRFSSALQDVSPDMLMQPHGMAIKVLGVEGPKLLEGHENATTQDFVMINHPVFFTGKLSSYVELFQAQAGDQKDLMAFAKNNPDVIRITAEMTANKCHNPLAVQYWSQTPYKFGNHVSKYSLRPLSGAENKRPDSMLPDYLRTAMVETIKNNEVRFEFLVQLQKDVKKQPLEDPTVVWDPADTQPIRVATLVIPKQDISGDRNLQVAENLSYSVWHSIQAHKPLGAINRARGVIYKAGAEQRREANGVEQREEPTEIPKISGKAKS